MRSRARPETYRSALARRAVPRLDSSLTSSSEAKKTNCSEMCRVRHRLTGDPLLFFWALLLRRRYHGWPRGASEHIKSVPGDVSRQTNQ